MSTPEQRRLAGAIGSLAYENPFLPSRIEAEREILGEAFVADTAVWSRDLRQASRPNIAAIADRAETLARELRGLRSPLYEDLVTYVLYERYSDRLADLAARETNDRVAFYDDFAADARDFLDEPPDLAHLFACLYQVRRAFLHTFTYLIGTSMRAAQLRADVWNSIFTRDLRRYRRSLFGRMNDITTLIVGPTGTGKELVAQAIALSRYIPFDERTRRFAAAGPTLFAGLNLSAMSPSLIESELFGHRKGAFTGALADREGWLEACSASGTVFLDEVGELDPSIQVKLLRVLQTRSFQRLGDTATRHFAGKIIAATNRDLAATGDFRRDFYYRLCSDVITTPSLREQLGETGDELRHLVLHVATTVAGPEEAETIAGDVMRVIARRLGPDYPWSGNFRELEQCVRSVVVRGDYSPSPVALREPAVLDGSMSEQQLLRWYTNLVYKQTGSYQEVARRLGIDRRTVSARLRSESPRPR
ncbi:MAG TPA: sigma 54-interacting transcriptional regulator [Thermoanaerobaculia bacterium]|jgi:DNA-binding NtrC family response regulator